MHHRAPTFGLGRLIVALILVYLAQAAYIMDDSDSTIQYHGPFWTQSIGDYLDTSKLFNKTASYSLCYTQDDCYVTIPFVGTGINVYNVVRAPMNISLAIDGGSPTVFIYHWDRQCWPDSSGCYHKSLFNRQSLTYDAHTLNITMRSYLRPMSPFGGANDFWFDYAVITSPMSSAVMPSSTGHLVPSSQRSQSLAATIGRLVGGIAVIMAVVLAARYYRKRRTGRNIERKKL